MWKQKLIKIYLITFGCNLLLSPIIFRAFFGSSILGVYIIVLGIMWVLYLPMLIFYLTLKKQKTEVLSLGFVLVGFLWAFIGWFAYRLATENWFGNFS